MSNSTQPTQFSFQSRMKRRQDEKPEPKLKRLLKALLKIILILLVVIIFLVGLITTGKFLFEIIFEACKNFLTLKT